VKKRIISLVICAVMLMGLNSVSIVASSENTNYEFELLTQLSLLPPSHTEEYVEDRAVTRGEFAYIMSRAMALSEMGLEPFDVISKFSDIREDNIYRDDIGLCVRFGILSGDGTELFRPTRKITYAQAVKVCLSALGYDEMAKVRGGFPSGYMICASESGILKGVGGSSDSAILAKDAYKLIVNTLDANMLKQTVFGDETKVLDNTSGDTILSYYHKIYKYAGQLRGTDEALLTDILPLESNQILIDNTIYKTDVKCHDYFGLNVYYYYDENEDKVVAVTPEKTYFKTLIVKAEDIISFSDNTLRYGIGDKIFEAKFSRETETVYNGRPAFSMKDNDYLISSGDIKLLDNEANNQYDVAIVSSAEIFTVKKTDNYNEVFYDMYDSSKSFSGKKTEIIAFKDEFGNDMQIAELSEYDVISVFISKDKKYAILYYSNSETEGRLDTKEVSGDRVIFNIGDKAYNVSANFADEAKMVQPGTEGIYIFDIYGNIAGIKPYGSSQYWGYLIATDKEGTISEKVQAKLLTEKEGVKVVDLCEDVILDGKAMKAVKAHEILSKETRGQVIRYYFMNSCLKYIDTVARGEEEGSDTLSNLYNGYDEKNLENTSLMYNRYQQVFGSKVALDPLAKVFRVPPEISSDDDHYKTLAISHFIHDTNYYIDAYRTSDNGHMAELVVMYKSGDAVDPILTTSEVTLVDRVTKAVTDSGEIKYVIHGLREGKQVSNVVKYDSIIDDLKSITEGKKDQKHNLVCGDVIKVAVDSVTGEITNLSLYYERETGTIAKNVAVGTSITDSNRMMKANVYSEHNGNIWITQNDLSKPGIELSIADIESVTLSSFKIYRYGLSNTGEPEIKISNAAEISDYKTNPELFSKIAIFSRYNNPGVLVIYE